jgi:hypothetical protein
MRSVEACLHCPLICIVRGIQHISKHCILNQWFIPDAVFPYSTVHYTQKLRLDDPGFKVRVRYTPAQKHERSSEIFTHFGTQKQKLLNSNWVLNYKLPFEHPEKNPGKREEETKGYKWTKFDLNRISKNTLTSMGLERFGGEGRGVNEWRYWMCMVRGCVNDTRLIWWGGVRWKEWGTNDCTVYKSVWTLGWWLKWGSES